MTVLMYSVYCTNQMHSINHIYILITYLWHASVQVYRGQGA